MFLVFSNRSDLGNDIPQVLVSVVVDQKNIIEQLGFELAKFLSLCFSNQG